MSDNGLVVGSVQAFSNQNWPFVWPSTPCAGSSHTDVILQPDDILPSMGGIGTIAYDVNDGGRVVGNTHGRVADSVAFIYGYPGGAWSLLGTLGGDGAQAWAVNEAGQVVGAACTPTGSGHAFLWTDHNENGQRDGAGTVDDEMIDLGTLGGSLSVANDINDLGQVVGEAATATGKTHAFLWTDLNGNGRRDDGEMLDLHPPDTPGDSQALAVSNLGQALGAADWPYGGYLWDNGEIVWLDDLLPAGWSFRPYDMNDNGQIVGTGSYENGTGRAILLTPVYEPEPLPGDLDGDGDVDRDDLAAFLSAFDTPDPGLADLDADGDCDRNDLAVFLGAYGTGAGTDEQTPEPATVLLLAFSGLAALRQRRR